MMPGGHLATSVALGGVAYAVTGSIELAVGCFTGGFLIDVDHYLDYIVFEKQWVRPGPASFLRYYFRNELKWVVLPLHSFELMAVLTIIALWYPQPLLVGYLVGAAMHLVFDIAVNGDYSIRNRYSFYFLAYRAKHGFSASELLEPINLARDTGSRPFREFFSWRPSVEESSSTTENS